MNKVATLNIQTIKLVHTYIYTNHACNARSYQVFAIYDSHSSFSSCQLHRSQTGFFHSQIYEICIFRSKTCTNADIPSPQAHKPTSREVHKHTFRFIISRHQLKLVYVTCRINLQSELACARNSAFVCAYTTVHNRFVYLRH